MPLLGSAWRLLKRRSPKMKVSLGELKKAIAYIEKNSSDIYPVVRHHVNCITISFINIDGQAVEIKVYDDATSLPPVVTSTERLK